MDPVHIQAVVGPLLCAVGILLYFERPEPVHRSRAVTALDYIAEHLIGGHAYYLIAILLGAGMTGWSYYHLIVK